MINVDLGELQSVDDFITHAEATIDPPIFDLSHQTYQINENEE